jgi:crossover junction endodeoxyribonuclease RuvC
VQYLIAIDPGKTGAMAVFNTTTRQPIALESFPLTKNKQIAFTRLNALVAPYANNAIAVLEKIHGYGMGVTSALNYGINTGAWLGVLAANGIHSVTVEARDWKKAMGLSSDKEQSLTMAKSLYPAMSHLLKRKKDHDRAEALLIGTYWLRHNKSLSGI